MGKDDFVTTNTKTNLNNGLNFNFNVDTFNNFTEDELKKDIISKV